MTEQETTNNLLVSIETAQEKIEQLEQKRDVFISKVAKRDHLIKGYEETIQELIGQLNREQGLLALALENQKLAESRKQEVSMSADNID